jgi:hypothetical protein
VDRLVSVHPAQWIYAAVRIDGIGTDMKGITYNLNDG